MLKAILITLVIGFVAACGGGNGDNNGVVNPTPPGTLPPGAVVKFSGSLFNINQNVAQDMVKTLNGSVYSAGQVIDIGYLEVTLQGMPYGAGYPYGGYAPTTGGTNYFVNMTLQPRPKNPWWNFCLTLGSNCNQPMIISGNAAYYHDGSGGHMLQLQYGGWKIQIIATSGSTDNVWNGTVTSVTNVKLKFIRPNQDPIVEGEFFANSDLYRYSGYGMYGNGSIVGYPGSTPTPTPYGGRPY
ncbi:MAG: hypothetical protein IPM57_00280 [Oligoflexia bacterium]|nr:hypothetical protein [Oligoflexia bacterium]